MGLAAHPRDETDGFSTERPWRHGRAGYLACHWRSRLSPLLSHTLAMPDSEPRTPVSGHGVRPSLCNQALVFGRENADHVIGSDDAAEFSLFIHNRQSEQIVLVKQLDDALAVGVETNLNRLSKRPLFQGRP